MNNDLLVIYTIVIIWSLLVLTIIIGVVVNFVNNFGTSDIGTRIFIGMFFIIGAIIVRSLTWAVYELIREIRGRKHEQKA